jgi:uncharacterized phage infection (PIP) family protein YhgE
VATLDDGVRNLERFLGYLALATGEVQRVATELAATEQELAQLERDAGEQGGALSDWLEELRSGIDSAAQEATDAVSALAEGGGAAREVVSEGLDRLQEGAELAEERVEGAGDDVDEGHARLLEQGFEALGQMLDGLGQDVETARGQAEACTDELLAGVQGYRTETDDAWAGADASTGQAAGDCAALAASVEESVRDSMQMLEAEGGAVEQACSSLAGDLDAIYDGLSQTADEEEKALAAALADVTEAVDGHVESGRADLLEGPSQELETGALPRLSAGLDGVAALLGDAASLREQLPALTADLAKCQVIVGKVDELLQAMAG